MINERLNLINTEKEGLQVGIKNNGVKYSVRKNRNRIFSPNEWISFYSQIKKDKCPIFNTLINTGARINEIINIKKSDFNFIEGTLTLRIIKKRTSWSDGNQRIIPISTEYLKYIKQYCLNFKDNDLLFPITKQAVYQLMRRSLKKSGIEDYWNFGLHNIRKTTETWLCSLNVGLPIILKHFGHNQSTALSYYIQIDFFKIEDKVLMRKIIGDLYSNQIGEFINRRFLKLEKTILNYNKRFKDIEKKLN